jgi:hypothetical protein
MAAQYRGLRTDGARLHLPSTYPSAAWLRGEAARKACVEGAGAIDDALETFS